MLIEKIRTYFSSASRIRGEILFDEKAVRLDDSLNDAEVCFCVQGSQKEPYDISIKWDDDEQNESGRELTVSCDCPHFRDGSMCKHLYAAFLYVELSTGSVEFPVCSEYQLVRQEDMYSQIFRIGPSSQPTRRTKSWTRRLDEIAEDFSDDMSWDFRHPDSKTRRVWFILQSDRYEHSEDILLTIEQQELLKSGSWGKLKSIPTQQDPVKLFSDPNEQEILDQIYSGPHFAGYHFNYYNSSCIRLRPKVAQDLLPKICALGRLIHSQDMYQTMNPISWCATRNCKFQAKILDKKNNYELAGYLQIEGDTYESLPMDSKPFSLVGSYIVVDNTMMPFNDNGQRIWLTSLRQSGALSVPKKHAQKFAQKIWTIAGGLHIDRPDDFPAKPPVSVPSPILRLEPPYHPQFMKAQLLFRYDGLEIPATHQSIVLPGKKFVRLRDEKREMELTDDLAEFAKLGHLKSQGFVQLHSDNLQQQIETLISKGWEVELLRQKLRVSTEFSVQTSSGIDWFELQGSATFGDESLDLPTLLKKIDEHSRFIKLSDGSMGILPDMWFRSIQRLKYNAEVDKSNKVKISKFNAAFLSAENDDFLKHFKPDKSYKKFITDLFDDKLTNFKVQPTSEFKGKLRPYQLTGLRWLAKMQHVKAGACLADDMGLGKTVQVLAHLQRLKADDKNYNEPVLLVVPRSLLDNWQRECRKFTPDLECIEYYGPGRKSKISQLSHADVVITTYSVLLKDNEDLQKLRYYYLILDEAQYIKNNRSKTYKACCEIAARHRLALSGTPVENHLGEFVALFDFLNPNTLKQTKKLSQLVDSALGNSDSDTLSLLARAFSPFVLRRKKQDVLKELPEKIEKVIYCDLTNRAKSEYFELKKYYQTSLLNKAEVLGAEKVQMHFLEALLRLRQCACDIRLLDPNATVKSSAKVEVLLEHLNTIKENGHKALVFSQFTSFLKIIRSDLDLAGIQYEYLDGQTRKRESRIESFKSDPSKTVFLISLKAGGVGLNLTEAEYCFILDPWWNPAAEAQAIDRAHRIGQKKQVLAYRLISRDTIEEKVMELQTKKKELVDKLLTPGSKGGFTFEQMQNLLQ